MNYHHSYFDYSTENFSNEETSMAYQTHFQKSPENTEEIEETMNSKTILYDHATTVKNKKFSLLWTINNFKEFMDRQYELTSPIFVENLSSGTSKWRMAIYPQNIYPEGVHVALRLFLLSKIEESYSVLYKVSFIDGNGKYHKLKFREKVFRHCLDFDECPVISNISLKEKNLLTKGSLIIKCELDLLECENLDIATYKSCENDSSVSRFCGNIDTSINNSCEIPDDKNYHSKKHNITSMTQSMNDLSYSKPFKKTSDSEKDVNGLFGKHSLQEAISAEFDSSNCKNKGLETLSNDLKHLYYNTNQHDVIIYVDDGKHTAHEIILSSRCDYFKKAIMSQGKEINVPGINLETLDAVLYYLYTGKLKQMTENSALDLLKAAKLLELPCLENMTTETFLSSRIKTNNVTNVFLMAKELKIESLKNSALKYMAENREEVIKTDQWNELMRSDPHSAGEVLLTVAYYQNKVPNNVNSI